MKLIADMENSGSCNPPHSITPCLTQVLFSDDPLYLINKFCDVIGLLWFLFLGFTLSLPNSSWAQSIPSISGTVTRTSDGAPISGAAIEVYQGASAVAVVTTDSIGGYNFTDLQAGNYTVQTSAVGYVTQNRTGVVVIAGSTATEDFSLAAVPANNAISYIYDELGRLVGIIDPAGESATYTYDAVGNLLSISRQSSTVVSIVEFAPNNGSIGTPVTISGTGFSTVANENTVTFNGIEATVVSAIATKIVVTVPAQATSGPIAVSNANGSATSSGSFTVTSQISITLAPNTATVVAGTSKQFTATVTGTTDQRVMWRLDGFGTITGVLSDTGLYSVPSTFVDTAKIVVKAISVADTSKFAAATVTVLPSSVLGAFVAPQVSVGTAAPPPSQSGPFIAPQVSVSTAAPSPSQSGPFIAPQVSVAPPPSQSGPFIAPKVSVTFVPIITAISPNSGQQDATNLTITITGTGLSGATSLAFFFNGAADTSIIASSIISNTEGTQVAADLTITASAPSGLRVVRITSSNGTSPAALMPGNTFTVTVP